MELNISKIVSDKLAEMEKNHVIEMKIMETLEKVLLDTITDELSSYCFRREIADQLKKSVHDIASDCGLSTYNGFIAETVKKTIVNMYTKDMAEKVTQKISDIMIQKHEKIKLSEIFKRYREFVRETVDEDEQRKYQNFCCDLEITNDGCFSWYKCIFSEEGGNMASRLWTQQDMTVRFLVFENEKEKEISSVYLEGRDMATFVKVGVMNEFEAFIFNLYFNKTPIILDVDEIDTEDNCYWIDE